MSDSFKFNIFNRRRMDDRAADELAGLANGLTADGKVTQEEAEFLQKWLAGNMAARDNPVCSNLLRRVDEMLKDGFLDPDEQAELMDTLSKFTGSNFDLGEIQKATTLPFSQPPPAIEIPGKSFVLTGTFAYGTRKDCEAAITDRGGKAIKSPTKKTDYVVIGVYATDSWAHSSYGRKIERAVELRDAGKPIAIVGEEYWAGMLLD